MTDQDPIARNQQDTPPHQPLAMKVQEPMPKTGYGATRGLIYGSDLLQGGLTQAIIGATAAKELRQFWEKVSQAAEMSIQAAEMSDKAAEQSRQVIMSLDPEAMESLEAQVTQAQLEAEEIYQRLDRELAAEEARADRLLRLYNL